MSQHQQLNMHPRQLNVLEKSLILLLDPSTSPEKALQFLKCERFSSKAYMQGDLEPVVIFLAYMRFLITRLFDGCVKGIWEDILRKTIDYSKNISFDGKEIAHVRRDYTRVVPAEGPQVTTWLQETLSSCSKCQNPYLRLELFRLLCIFNNDFNSDSNFEWITLNKPTCPTLIHTITEIQPHRLYASSSVDKVLFCFVNMDWYIFETSFLKLSQDMVSADIIEQLGKNQEVFVNSKGVRFLSNCIQLIGLWFKATGSITNPKQQIWKIRNVCEFFYDIICNMVNCREYLPWIGMSNWECFRYITSHSPFRQYIVETVSSLSMAIINNTQTGTTKDFVCNFRDIIAQDLDVCIATSNLPRLLLSSQVRGPQLLRKHSLLLTTVSAPNKCYKDGHNRGFYENIDFVAECINFGECCDVEDGFVEDF